MLSNDLLLTGHREYVVLAYVWFEVPVVAVPTSAAVYTAGIESKDVSQTPMQCVSCACLLAR